MTAGAKIPLINLVALDSGSSQSTHCMQVVSGEGTFIVAGEFEDTFLEKKQLIALNFSLQTVKSRTTRPKH